MRFEVFHRIVPTFMDNDDQTLAAFPVGFSSVGIVEVEEVGQVFQVTNHIDAPWYKNPEVICASTTARSSSVGDVFVNLDNGEKWTVQGIGLRKFHDGAKSA